MSTLDNPDLPTIAMLGVGSMGGAILEGLLAPSVNRSAPVRVTTNSEASAAKLNEHADVVAHAVEKNADANRVAARGAKAIIVGVKPWLVHDVLKEIADELDEGAVVISVAAGVTIDSMRVLLPSYVSVLRVMPNTPSLVGRGVSGVVGVEDTPAEALDLTSRLFSTVGDVIVVNDEAQLDALSAISGSGPAYVFYFIEKLTAAAERLGFTNDQARRMVEGTFLGASMLLDHQGSTPEALRLKVTSPNGTTEKAIESFSQAGLDAVMDDAVGAAIARAQQLARGE
ncbi:pyrroline-5-carboxylate reductase [Leucobacter chinensis]|uniref:pyrroline-5-carboxylate reductase n=1 Tax=Leucobacter chinensis TaxID=2851010 RepID=UPI0020B7A25C|nr:pyrroline-5-carboxylate reductase [Leucobacter chinensis]